MFSTIHWDFKRVLFITIYRQSIWHGTFVTGVWLQPCGHVFHKSICSEFWFSSTLHFQRLEETDTFWHRSPLLSTNSFIPCPPVLNQMWQHLPIQKEEAVSAYYPFSYCFFFWMSLRGRAAVCPHTMKYMWWDYILRERLCTWDHSK